MHAYGLSIILIFFSLFQEPEINIDSPIEIGKQVVIRPDFYLKEGNNIERVGKFLEISLANLYIEFWGLSGETDYDAKRKFKLDAYSKNGLKLIELFEADMKNYSSVLHKKLSPYVKPKVLSL